MVRTTAIFTVNQRYRGAVVHLRMSWSWKGLYRAQVTQWEWPPMVRTGTSTFRMSQTLMNRSWPQVRRVIGRVGLKSMSLQK